MNNKNGSKKEFTKFQYQYERQQSTVTVPNEYRYDYLKNWLNPLNAVLNPICHMPALLGAHHILHVSSIEVKQKTITCINHQTPAQLQNAYS